MARDSGRISAVVAACAAPMPTSRPHAVPATQCKHAVIVIPCVVGYATASGEYTRSSVAYKQWTWEMTEAVRSGRHAAAACLQSRPSGHCPLRAPRGCLPVAQAGDREQDEARIEHRSDEQVFVDVLADVQHVHRYPQPPAGHMAFDLPPLGDQAERGQRRIQPRSEEHTSELQS